jgi:hypothetical protein
MSTSTMLDEFRKDRATAHKIETYDVNGWGYTRLETCRGVHVAITNPRGKFTGYYPLPRASSENGGPKPR